MRSRAPGRCRSCAPATKRIFLETRATLYRLAKVSRRPLSRSGRRSRTWPASSTRSRWSPGGELRLHDRAQRARAGRHLEAAQFNLGTRRSRAASWGRGEGRFRPLRTRISSSTPTSVQRHFPATGLNDPELTVESLPAEDHPRRGGPLRNSLDVRSSAGHTAVPAPSGDHFDEAPRLLAGRHLRVPARADEGMWTFDNFPRPRSAKYGFAPDAQWLGRPSSPRAVAGGCRGAASSRPKGW